MADKKLDKIIAKRRFLNLMSQYKNHLKDHVEGTAWFYPWFLDELNNARRKYLKIAGLKNEELPPDINGPRRRFTYEIVGGKP